MAWRLAVLTVLLGTAFGVGYGFAASLSLSSQKLTPYRTCTVTATPITTTAVADTHVLQALATSNFGSAASMNVATASTANRRIYISFDLAGCNPAIPSTATLRLATLRFLVSSMPAVCRTVDIFRVTSSWTETGITWNNQPFGTALNNPPQASRTDSFDIGSPVGCENRTTGVFLTGATVTSDVAAFVAGGATNFGWMLRDDVEGSATTYTSAFPTKQQGSLSLMPMLVVTYVDVP